jgi:hypothetical protein
MSEALVNHPFFGSVWLEHARIEGDYVIGDAWERGSSWNMPDDYTGEYTTMNFPKSCIRKWVD